jgi:hypothetical protein
LRKRRCGSAGNHCWSWRRRRRCGSAGHWRSELRREDLGLFPAAARYFRFLSRTSSVWGEVVGNDQNLLEEEDLQMQQEGREESLTQSGREDQEQSDNLREELRRKDLGLFLAVARYSLSRTSSLWGEVVGKKAKVRQVEAGA